MTTITISLAIDDDFLLPSGFEDFVSELLLPKTDINLIRGFLLSYKTYTTPQQLYYTWEKLFLQSTTPLTAVGFLLDWIQFFSQDFDREMINCAISTVSKHKLPASIINQVKLLMIKANTSGKASTINIPKRNSLPTNSKSEQSIHEDRTPKRTRSNLSLSFSHFPTISISSLSDFQTNRKQEKKQSSIYMEESIKIITSLDAKEVARSLTMREFKQIEKVSLREILNNGWQSDNKHQVSPNITHMIEISNQVGYWVATQLMVATDPKKQTAILEKLIAVASECEKLSNFNTLMEILSGLNNVSVSRLSKLWASISDKSRKKFEELDKLMSPLSNFKRYRDQLASRKGPVLPYIGVILRDSTFVSEGNKATFKGQINKYYLTLMWERAKTIDNVRNKKYSFTTNSFVDSYVADLDHLSNDNELFFLSKKWMPSQCL